MSGLASVYPPPPPYYKAYTDEKVAQLKQEVPKDQQNALDTETGLQAGIPADLAALLPPPPPPPEAQSYRGFGSIWNIHDQLLPLEAAGMPRLYPPDTEHMNTRALARELRKLLHSVLVKVVSLIVTMAQDPERFPSVVEDLRVLFINMHHLLNVYRPLQSRESLMLRMSDEISQKRERTAALRTANATIRARVDALAARLPRLHASEGPSTPNNDDWPSELL